MAEKPKFFIHVNTLEIEGSGEEAVLEINGSHEPSKFKARLFMDHNYMQHLETNSTSSNILHSGAPIRLLHKEVNGYLTVSEKEVDLLLPPFPDFLQKQIKIIN